MMLKVFSLYDTKTGLHGTPFVMQHVGQAIRACQDLAGDLNTTVGRHPADYMLVELGTFDDNTGAFDNAYSPIATVVSFIERRAAAPLFDDQRPVAAPVAGFAGEM